MSSQRGKRAVVEAGEASESDEGEGELFQESQTPTKRTSMKSTDSPLSKMGTQVEQLSIQTMPLNNIYNLVQKYLYVYSFLIGIFFYRNIGGCGLCFISNRSFRIYHFSFSGLNIDRVK